MPVSIYALSDPAVNQFLIRYIGKTKFELEKRLYSHIRKSQLGSKFHVHNWLRKINFKAQIKLIEIVPKGKSWKKAEKKWIKYYRDNGYPLTNETEGGEGLSNPSIATRRKMSKTHVGFLNGKHTEETKRKMSLMRIGNKYNLGRKHSAERNLKNRLAHLGRYPSIETRRKMSIASRGRKHSEETRRKLSESTKRWFQTHPNPMLGKRHTLKTRKQISETWRKKYAKN